MQNWASCLLNLLREVQIGGRNESKKVDGFERSRTVTGVVGKAVVSRTPEFQMLEYFKVWTQIVKKWGAMVSSSSVHPSMAVVRVTN